MSPVFSACETDTAEPKKVGFKVSYNEELIENTGDFAPANQLAIETQYQQHQSLHTQSVQSRRTGKIACQN